MSVHPIQHVPIVKSRRPENSGFYNDFRPSSLYSVLYPSPNTLGMFKPHGIYKPLDRLMRYEGNTNGTPRYHPSLSIFKNGQKPVSFKEILNKFMLANAFPIKNSDV